MKGWIAFSSIFVKDMPTYYLKPPNAEGAFRFPSTWDLFCSYLWLPLSSPFSSW